MVLLNEAPFVDGKFGKAIDLEQRNMGSNNNR